MRARSDLKIELPSEPVLDGVLDEDRGNVRDVIYVLHALSMFASWSVTPKDHWYEIVALTDPKTNTEVSLQDLDLLRSVDRLRIESVTVRGVAGQAGGLSVVIHVMRKSEPVVLEEQEIVRIQKKRKFWCGF
jgi:hypothetical protein